MVTINPKIYPDAKAKGAVKFLHIHGDTFTALMKQFDPLDGKPLPEPVRADVNLTELKNQREVTKKLLDGMDQMIADLEALKPKTE